ncbi:unnamed protein product [Blepharisma stoltei]|uniref:FYVE-type domain-containing protein n=1 Tax=Blepharisma stoltei TaxID=1481888 RepID=A0AAU9K058_9CILI|nr:unnamed protein product [Blepharisma stoltei]
MESNLKRSFSSKLSQKSKRCKYCNTKAKHCCKICENKACNFHCYKRFLDGKQWYICDHCHYYDVKEVIEKQNEDDMTSSLVALRGLIVDNARLEDEIEENNIKANRILEKLSASEASYKESSESKSHMLSIEKVNNEQLSETYFAYQSALREKKRGNETLKEKLQKKMIEINQIKMEVDQLKGQESQFTNHISSLAEQSQSCIYSDKLEEILCQKCQIRVFGRSFLIQEPKKPSPSCNCMIA